jgi:hypothetical protein
MAIYIFAALILAYALAMWWFWWRPSMTRKPSLWR